MNFCRVAAHVAANCHDVEGTGLIEVGALQRVAAWCADRRVGYPRNAIFAQPATSALVQDTRGGSGPSGRASTYRDVAAEVAAGRS